jgi:hypothetical protein
MRSWLGRLGCSLAIAAWGCGEATLSVRLAHLDTEDPFSGVVELGVGVMEGSEIGEQARQPYDGETITLDPIARRSSTRVLIAGYSQTGALVARGDSGAVETTRGETCCIWVCFCVEATFNAGTCTCGTSTCAAECGASP